MCRGQGAPHVARGAHGTVAQSADVAGRGPRGGDVGHLGVHATRAEHGEGIDGGGGTGRGGMRSVGCGADDDRGRRDRDQGAGHQPPSPVAGGRPGREVFVGARISGAVEKFDGGRIVDVAHTARVGRPS